MKIYTKTGDKGLTYLYGGKRESKNSAIISVIGGIDELNSFLGLTYTSRSKDKKIKALVIKLQRELFNLGAVLAISKEKTPLNEIQQYEKKVKELERHIDEIDKKLPALKNFIVPSGEINAVYFHVARAICRRVERHLVKEVKNNRRTDLIPIIKYINRLSDLLFVLARYSNKSSNEEEIVWGR